MTAPSDLTDEAQFQLYLCLLGEGNPEALPAIAMQLLEAGLDSKPLIQLAIADSNPHPADVRELASQACASLGWPVPSLDDDPRDLAKVYCKRISSGRMPPKEGLSRMYKIWLQAHYQLRDRFYDDWMYLADSIDNLDDEHSGIGPFEHLTPENTDETIRQLAEDFQRRLG